MLISPTFSSWVFSSSSHATAPVLVVGHFRPMRLCLDAIQTPRLHQRGELDKHHEGRVDDRIVGLFPWTSFIFHRVLC